ncbi:MAG: serine hydrolase [Nocardioidaceae bacterium]
MGEQRGDRVAGLAAEHDATISVWMGALDGTAWRTHDADVEHPAASTLKLPLLIAVHTAAEAGLLELDDALDIHAEFRSVVPGKRFTMTADYDNDPAPWSRVGERASIRWLAERAIILSSNLATNLLIERVGIGAVNAVYDAAGATTSRLRRSIQDDPASAAGVFNTATATEMAAVLIAVLGGRFTSPGTTAELERVLAACETNDAIPAGLPDGTYIAHKTGWIDDACHDVALVRPAGEDPFVLSIYSGARLGDPAIHRLVAEVAAVCWEERTRR